MSEKTAAAPTQTTARAEAAPARAAPAERAPTATMPSLGNLLDTLARSGIRRKATISQAGDPDEDEADRVAETLTSTSPTIQRKCAACAVGAPCTSCDGVQRKAARPSVPDSRSAESAVAAVGGGGRALPPLIRAEFESRSGRDLGHVRVHTGPTAASAASAIQALAYTHGPNIAFASGQYRPETHAGRVLLAHEVAHVLQQGRSPGVVQRQPEPEAEEKPVAKPEQEPPRYESDLIVDGWTIRGNKERMKWEQRQIAAAKGRNGPQKFLTRVKEAFERKTPASPTLPFGTPRTSYDAAAEVQIWGELAIVVAEVEKELDAFVADFQAKSKQIALAALDANEKVVNTEAERYGIKTVRTKVPVSDCLAGDCEYEKREHSMSESSPAGKDLQVAAKLLAARRKDIDDVRDRRDKLHHVRCHKGECFDTYDPGYEAANQELAEKVSSYNKFRDTLADKFPVLEQFADLGKSASDLGTLAAKGPGSEMAALVGEQIADKTDKIGKSRTGLDSGEVNVWHLPKIIGLTRAAMQVDVEPWKKRMVDDAIVKNEPGIWQHIALAVLNIAALLLAGPTGGLSLAVMAGVNVVVAVHDVREYLMKDALANSSFRAAQALSQDQPSLFWLALEIVGTVADVGAAAAALSKSVSAFRKLAPLVDNAKFAQGGADAEKAIQELSKVAEELKGAEFAKRVVAQVRRARGGGGGSADLIAAGAKADELTKLESVAKAGDRAVLGETRALDLDKMRPDQVHRELDLLDQGKRITPSEGYVEAIRLDNGHVWQRTPEGQWCRHSNPLCLIFGDRGGYHVKPPPPKTHMPANKGSWEGDIGNSEWLSEDLGVLAVTRGEGIPFRNGYPNFSKWSRGKVGIQQTKDRTADFAAADKLFAKERGWLHNGQPNAAAAERFRVQNGLTWHHHEDGRTMQLIPTALHGNVPHAGGVSGVGK